MNARTTVESIQMLRGVAALMVVVYHAKAGLSFNGAIYSAASNLNAGVDIFFIISGFVIAQSARSANFLSFAIRRFLRIYPLWAITVVALFWITQSPSEHMFWKSLHLWPQSVTEQGPFYNYPWPAVGWTLRYELAFYAIFTVALAVGRLSPMVIATAIIGSLLTMGFFFKGQVSLSAMGDIATNSATFAIFTNPIFVEFLAGMMLAKLYALPIQMGRMTTSLTSITLIASASAMMLSGWLPGHGIIGYGLPALLSVGGFLLLERQGAYRSSEPLSYLGTISFCVYLVHPLANIVLRKSAILDDSTIGFTIASILLSVGAASVMHHTLERPLLAASKLIGRAVDAGTIAALSQLRGLPLALSWGRRG